MVVLCSSGVNAGGEMQSLTEALKQVRLSNYHTFELLFWNRLR